MTHANRLEPKGLTEPVTVFERKHLSMPLRDGKEPEISMRNPHVLVRQINSLQSGGGFESSIMLSLSQASIHAPAPWGTR